MNKELLIKSGLITLLIACAAIFINAVFNMRTQYPPTTTTTEITCFIAGNIAIFKKERDEWRRDPELGVIIIYDNDAELSIPADFCFTRSVER